MEDVRQSPAYFESRQSKMEYAYFRQAGYPIGSGTVESGVNTVVHHRMKRQGRGWKRKNAQAMLAALSEFHSGCFQIAWQSGLMGKEDAEIQKEIAKANRRVVRIL